VVTAPSAVTTEAPQWRHRQRGSSVTSLSGTKPYFFNSLGMSFNAARLFLLLWTRTSSTSPSASTARHR
jgi:hypothetical protein